MARRIDIAMGRAMGREEQVSRALLMAYGFWCSLFTKLVIVENTKLCTSRVAIIAIRNLLLELDVARTRRYETRLGLRPRPRVLVSTIT